MDQLTRSNKHRAKVIEIYENGLRAAVEFTNGCIECVVRRGMTSEFILGQRGMVDYVRCLNGWEWTFIPFKSLYECRMMMGRLTDDTESDHGKLVHACEIGKTIAYGHGKAICGAKPGKRSAGWSVTENKPVTCPRCIKKIENENT